MSRKVSDSQIVKALLECETQQKAAERLGITPQTIINRMKNADFIAKYNNVQNELLRATTRKLANASGKSADLLIKTMDNPKIDLSIRIGIAKDILRLQRDFTSIDELQRRISKIEYDNAIKDQEADEENKAENQYKTFRSID